MAHIPDSAKAEPMTAQATFRKTMRNVKSVSVSAIFALMSGFDQ